MLSEVRRASTDGRATPTCYHGAAKQSSFDCDAQRAYLEHVPTCPDAPPVQVRHYPADQRTVSIRPRIKAIATPNEVSNESSPISTQSERQSAECQRRTVRARHAPQEARTWFGETPNTRLPSPTVFRRGTNAAGARADTAGSLCERPPVILRRGDANLRLSMPRLRTPMSRFTTNHALISNADWSLYD